MVDADIERINDYHLTLVVGGRRHRLVTATHGPVHLVEVDGVAHRVSRDEGGVLRSPAPALVVATPVSVGSIVAAGAPVLVLESMKMETLLHAPFAAKVRELLVSTGSQVETGAPLIRLEPVADEGAEEAEVDDSAGIDLDLPSSNGDASAEDRARRGLADLSAMLLGYDIDPADEGAHARELPRRPRRTRRRRARLVARRTRRGQAVRRLRRTEPQPARRRRTHVENRVHSPREHFHTYLQSLDVERGGLPDAFRARLERVLAHYGITGAERTDELEEAVFRIFLAQRRSAPDVAITSTLLQRWLTEPAPEQPLAAVAHDVLDRLVLAAQLRFPLVGDQARSVRFRWFDQPIVAPRRAPACWPVSGERSRRSRRTPTRQIGRSASTRSQRSPSRSCRSSPNGSRPAFPSNEPMLEVLIRRHYREYDLDDLRSVDVRRPAVRGGRLRPRRPPDPPGLHRGQVRRDRRGQRPGRGADRAGGRRAAGQRPSSTCTWPGRTRPSRRSSRPTRLAELLGELPFAHDVRRVAVAVCPGAGRAVTYFTLRPRRRGHGRGLPRPRACTRWSGGG